MESGSVKSKDLEHTHVGEYTTLTDAGFYEKSQNERRGNGTPERILPQVMRKKASRRVGYPQPKLPEAE